MDSKVITLSSSEVELTTISTANLKRLFIEGVKLTAQNLKNLSLIWVELERRGEDLSDLRSSITDFLPVIAGGSLSPDAVLKFAGQKKLLSAIATLPLSEQTRLVDGGTIEYVDDEGNIRDVFPQEIPAKSVEFVIRDGAVLTKGQQFKELEKRPVYKKRRGSPRIHIDVDNDALIIAGMSIPREKIATALWELAQAKKAHSGSSD
ncbi:hypothetical protein ACS91J_04590 [Pectobacterium carotovorum]